MHNEKPTVSMLFMSRFERAPLLETLSDAVISLNEMAVVLYANEKAVAMMGAYNDEVVGQTLWQSAPNLVSIILYRAVVNALHTRIPFQVEYRSPVMRSWLRMYLSPTSEGIALFFHEETEPTRLQDPLRQSEGTYLEILESITERVAILTPDGLLLEINQLPLAVARVQRNEVVGKPFTQFPSWSAAPGAQEQLRAAIMQASRGVTVHFEARIRPQPDRYLDLAVTLTSHRDANQRVEYLIFAGRDITERKQVEEERRALVEAIPQLVWIARPDGYVTYNNQRLIDYLAMTYEQVKGDGWIACVYPADRDCVRDVWRTRIQAGMPYETEYRMRNGMTGEYRWFLIRAVPQKNAQGVILSWIGTATDINEQKQAQERIKASEQSLRTLAEMVPQLVWTARPNGRVDYVNQRFQDLTQADFEQLRDYGWRQFVHPEDLERTLMLRQRSLETGEFYESEYRLRDGRTGAYRWFLARAHPVHDELGQITKWFGTGTDIDGQKRTEQALRRSQEQVHTLMDSNVIGILRSEGEEIIEANNTFLHMIGYSQEDLRHRRLNWVHMTAPEYQEITRRAHQQLALYQYMAPYEKEYVCKDGGRLAVLVGGVMTQLDPLQIICFVLDNSARKELEQRKDNFLSMASHELRTPLTSLKLQTQMLRKQLVKQDTHRAGTALCRMEGQLNAVTRLVEELFDLSKIQAGKLEYAQETVNLNDLLQEIVEVVQQTQTTHTILLSAPAHPVHLIGDRDRLGQVFLNLLSNAIKYSPAANQVEVAMTTSAETLMISVHDHGIGIPREQHEKIFERFHRASAQHGRIPGLGMGLYIVAEIVKHHGGTITIESDVGASSTFQVTLPLNMNSA